MVRPKTKISKIYKSAWVYELRHEAEKWFQTLSDIRPIKKKQNDKMTVTFLKFNIFWLCFFLTISTYPETFKNGIDLPKTNLRVTNPLKTKIKIKIGIRFVDCAKIASFGMVRSELSHPGWAVLSKSTSFLDVSGWVLAV